MQGWDPLRLAVDVRGTGTTGHRVAALMHELDDVNVELASESVVVAIFGMGPPAADDVKRLLGALRHAITVLGDVEHEPARPLRHRHRGVQSGCRPARHSSRPRTWFRLRRRRAGWRRSPWRPTAGNPDVLPREVLTAETLDDVRETLAQGARSTARFARSGW